MIPLTQPLGPCNLLLLELHDLTGGWHQQHSCQKSLYKEILDAIHAINAITYCWCLVIVSKFYASTIRTTTIVIVHSLAFGGKGCYFSNRKSKKLGRGIFNDTLGYPGEGPEEVNLIVHIHAKCAHTFTKCSIFHSHLSTHVVFMGNRK